MRSSFGSWTKGWAILGLVLLGLGQPAFTPAQGESRAGKHALLVGVTHYPQLNERFHLKGPANDVVLLRDLLTKTFAFPEANVAVLSEADGLKDASRLPTKANIQREFARLAKVAQAGDQIVVMMGGHGSQQPESDNPAAPEPDGLDEIFLPRDVGEWDGDVGKVPGAITDDEIGTWLKAIQARGAFVWIVFDSCHSGTMIRGVNERERQIKGEQDLKIPREAIRKAQLKAAKRFPEATRGGGSPETGRSHLPEGGIVAIYACQEIEVTVEKDLPTGSPDAKPYGLLSYTIAQVLTQAFQNNGKPPTYRELLQRINATYGRLGRTSPTPQIEGAVADRDREVLGTSSWPGRSLIRLTQESGRGKINAGSLHGMTEGTILAVLPTAEEKGADKVLGYVKVENLKTLSAMVEPIEFNKMPALATLPTEGRCEIAQVDLGQQKLRIALDLSDDGKPIPTELATQLKKDLDTLSAKWKTLLEHVGDPANADWLVRTRQGKVFLLPAAESTQKLDPGSPGLRFGPYLVNAKLADTLQDRVLRIIRSENLKRMAGSSAGDVARGAAPDAQIKLDVEMFRMVKGADRKPIPLTWDSGHVQLYDGDEIGMVVRNNGRFAVDVTILYIDAGFGIDCYFPAAGELNRIRPDNVLQIPAMQIEGSKTFGPENIMVIAVKGTTKEPIDFSFLAQPSLEQARNLRPKEMPKSDLEQVLESSLFGRGTTRAVSRRAVEEFSLRMLPWNVSPKSRPNP